MGSSRLDTRFSSTLLVDHFQFFRQGVTNKFLDRHIAFGAVIVNPRHQAPGDIDLKTLRITVSRDNFVIHRVSSAMGRWGLAAHGLITTPAWYASRLRSRENQRRKTHQMQGIQVPYASSGIDPNVSAASAVRTTVRFLRVCRGCCGSQDQYVFRHRYNGGGWCGGDRCPSVFQPHVFSSTVFSWAHPSASGYARLKCLSCKVRQNCWPKDKKSCSSCQTARKMTEHFGRIRWSQRQLYRRW